MALIRSIATVGGYTMASRVLGFVRDVLIARVLGTGEMADAFFVAQRLPNLFRSLFAEGAFNAAFLPRYTAAATKAGTTDPKKVMDTIKAGSWDTVIGTIEYDSKGDIKQLDYVVYRWDSKGGYVEINPKGS